MALAALLIGVVLGAYAQILQASALNLGAVSLRDLLDEARDDAVTRNAAVEVRLYDLPGSADPTPAYRAAQLHSVSPDGTRPAIDPLLLLPPTVVMDATIARVFHFFSDGSTDLTAGSAWFVTLRAANQSDPAHFPADWSTITIDPITGRTDTFRP